MKYLLGIFPLSLISSCIPVAGPCEGNNTNSDLSSLVECFEVEPDLNLQVARVRVIERLGEHQRLVFLHDNTGGSGVYWYVGLQTSRQDAVTTPILLGDRISVLNVDEQEAYIVITMLVAGPNDPMCCPSTERTKAFAMGDTGLTEVSELDRPFGAPSLTGTHWRLIDSGTEGFGPEIRFEGNKLFGLAGCNRFNAEFSLSANGKIRVSPVESTMMLCPPPIDAVETAFLSSLQSSVELDFSGMELQVVYPSGADFKRMRFELDLGDS